MIKAMGIKIGILLLLVSGTVIEAVPTLTPQPAAPTKGSSFTLICELAGFTTALMNFNKDGAIVYTCGSGGQTCDDSGGLSDYSEVDWSEANKGKITISNAEQSRDGGDWTCAVGGGGVGAGTSNAVTLTITVPDCGNPTKPTNGQVSVTTTTYQSTATYSCDSGYTIDGTATTTCQTDGTWSGTVPTCTAAPCSDCFCKVWCIVLVVIVIIYGTSWIVASVVNLVIYNMNQMRLPWHLCDGNLKKWQSWLLLFIFVPYVPSGVAIYLFNTKRPGYDRCVGAPGTDISINFKYTVSSSGEVTVQVKNEAGTILVSVKFIDGKVAGKADINPRVDFTRNVTTGDVYFKLNNIQTSDSGLYTLSGNDVPCSCVELFVTDKPTSGTEMNKFGTH